MATRFFEYVGAPALTRGDYGVRISGGRSGDGEDADYLFVSDSDFGDGLVCSIDAALESGEWREISRDEWLNLR